MRRGDGKSAWYIKELAPLFGEVLIDIPERTSSEMKAEDTPLKGKVIAVTNPPMHSYSFFGSSAAFAGEMPTPPGFSWATTPS